MSGRNVRGSILLTLIALAAVIFGFWQLGSMIWRPSADRNPFEYPMADLSVIDRKLIGFQETEKISLPLSNARAVCVAEDGRMGVVGDRKLLVYRDSRIENEFEFDEPALCVAADEDSGWFVCLATRVEKMAPAGGSGSAVYPLPAKSVLPTGMIVTDGALWISDAARKTIWQLAVSGAAGEGWVRRPADGGHFVIPSPFFDLACGRDGQIWAANPGRHQVENVTRDGRIRWSWGGASTKAYGFCGCCNPTHLALMPDGSFVTSEKGIVRIKLTSPKGELISIVATPDDFDPGTTGLDLAVDNNGRILVLDPVRRMIRIFIPLPDEFRAQDPVRTDG